MRHEKPAIFREVELDDVNMREIPGAVLADVEARTRRLLAKKYLEKLRIYLEKQLRTRVEVIVRNVRPVMVEGIVSLDDFARAVKGKIRFSRFRRDVEMAAVECITGFLRSHGYEVVEPYFAGPRPFDMVVGKEGALYTVECKGRRVKPGEPLSITLTSNEADWGLKFSHRHLI